MNWKLKYLLPSRRRGEEREMQEELDSLAHTAGDGALGNLTLAAGGAREASAWPLDGVLADIRYAFRTMRKNPSFTAIAAVTLALGIGANSAMFSFGDAILLRPLPVKRPSEIVRVSSVTPNDSQDGMSYPDYRDLRRGNHSFSGLSAYKSITVGVGAASMAPRIRQALLVSDNFFSTLGVGLYLGRALSSGEGGGSDRDPIVVLGYDFWAAEFGASRSAIGRPLRVNGVEFTIAGVAPKSFTGMDRFFSPSVFVPLLTWDRLEGAKEDPIEDRARHELQVVARLKAGVSQEAAQVELAALGQDLQRAYPKTNSNRRIAVRTDVQAIVSREPVRLAMVTMLMVLAGVVLVIACANVANLGLARARARRCEIAVRLSIGAGKFRLLRQLMTESLTLALLGGLLGLVFGYGAILFLGTIQIPSEPPFVLDLRLDTRVLLFSLLATLLSCLLFGLAPALQAGRVQLVPALKAGGNGFSGRGRRLIGRNALVVSQIALAVVLLFAASMLFEGFRKMLRADPGFRTDHLLSIDIDPAVLRYSPQQTRTFYQKLIANAGAMSGVASVSLTESVPLSLDQSRMTVVPEGYQLPPGRDTVTEFGGAVDENYFGLFHIKIVRGRGFSADDRSTSRRVAIVNEEFAKTYWPAGNVIGKRLRLGAGGPMAEVVGVAKTARYLLPWEEPKPYVYLPYQQNLRSRMSIVAESRGDPATLLGPLRHVIQKLDPDMPVYNARTVASYGRATLGNWMIIVQMTAMMGLLGLTLALVGLYGLISYSVSRRTAEIGVRMAVGASRRDVLRLVLGQAVIVAVSGIMIGGAVTAMVGPVLSAALVGLGNMSVANYVAIPVALLAVSAAACYVPARRAARLDPMRALRYE